MNRGELLQAVATGLHRSGLSGGLASAAGWAGRGPAFAILKYHRVNDHRDPFFEAMGTAVFQRQVQHLARHYTVLSVEELMDRVRAGRLPRNAAAITFDDGYRDTLTHAAPILAAHGLPATVFLATGFMGTTEVPWYDRLAGAFKQSPRSHVVAPTGEELPLETVEDRLRALERVRGHLKSLSEDQFRRAFHRQLESLGATERQSTKNAMLSWDDVHALRGLGFCIGAHTVSHPILSRVTPERARAEVLGSREMIQGACGITPRAFAYPNGGPADYTSTVVDIVREAGFSCAVTTRFGVNTGRTSPWELHRGQPWEEHLPTFALKLAWYRMTLR
jgi:peptidoglycan/xylan/chitin deacetylase (PgdA/CDA1 family)